MGGVKRPIHPAALAAGYAQDRSGTGQIARGLPSWHCASPGSRRSHRAVLEVLAGRHRAPIPKKEVDHEGSQVLRAAEIDDDRGGRICAASRPLDAEPLA
jgi:hypothetical protein